MTKAPSKVALAGTSEKINQPRRLAQTRSRNFTDCVDEISLTPNERVKQ